MKKHSAPQLHNVTLNQKKFAPIPRTTQLNSGAVFTLEKRNIQYKMPKKPWDPSTVSMSNSERELGSDAAKSWGRNVSSAEETNQSINHARDGHNKSRQGQM